MEPMFTTTVPDGGNLTLTADAHKRYTLHFHPSGMKFEFIMLAGQTFKVTGLASHITVDMTDIEPALPGGGLQLVPGPTLQ